MDCDSGTCDEPVFLSVIQTGGSKGALQSTTFCHDVYDATQERAPDSCVCRVPTRTDNIFVTTRVMNYSHCHVLHVAVLTFRVSFSPSGTPFLPDEFLLSSRIKDNLIYSRECALVVQCRHSDGGFRIVGRGGKKCFLPNVFSCFDYV